MARHRQCFFLNDVIIFLKEKKESASILCFSHLAELSFVFPFAGLSS